MVIMTASRTLLGKEVRSKLTESVADLYHDLDKGFTPINFLFPNLPLPSYRKRDEAHIKMRNVFIDVINTRRASGDKVTNETNKRTQQRNSTIQPFSFLLQDSHDLVQTLLEATYKDGSKV